MVYNVVNNFLKYITLRQSTDWSYNNVKSQLKLLMYTFIKLFE